MFPTILLVLFAASCAVTAVVFLAALRWGEGRRKLVVLLAALLAVALVWLGGGAILERFGLYWRRGLVTVFLLSGAGLFLGCFSCALRNLLELPREKGIYVTAGVLSALLLSVCIAGFGFLRMLFGGFTDHVGEYQGQKVVVEYSGIFHEDGYRYVNWFVHGEKVYEWDD